MEAQLLIAGFVLTALFYFMDKTFIPSAMREKRYILDKLQKNRDRDMRFLQELETLVADCQAWSQTAFPESDTTYADYIEALKEKHSIEYSEGEFTILKSRKLASRQINDYVEKIKNQDETILAYRADLEYLRLNLQRNAS